MIKRISILEIITAVFLPITAGSSIVTFMLLPLPDYWLGVLLSALFAFVIMAFVVVYLVTRRRGKKGRTHGIAFIIF